MQITQFSPKKKSAFVKSRWLKKVPGCQTHWLEAILHRRRWQTCGAVPFKAPLSFPPSYVRRLLPPACLRSKKFDQGEVHQTGPPVPVPKTTRLWQKRLFTAPGGGRETLQHTQKGFFCSVLVKKLCFGCIHFSFHHRNHINLMDGMKANGLKGLRSQTANGQQLWQLLIIPHGPENEQWLWVALPRYLWASQGGRLIGGERRLSRDMKQGL